MIGLESVVCRARACGGSRDGWTHGHRSRGIFSRDYSKLRKEMVTVGFAEEKLSREKRSHAGCGTIVGAGERGRGRGVAATRRVTVDPGLFGCCSFIKYLRNSSFKS